MGEELGGFDLADGSFNQLAKLSALLLGDALSQLERLQRMRLGQPVLPPVKVELST